MKRGKYKSRHNKKRNTAFLYEVLVQEITRSVIGKDDERKEKALNICKEFFGKNSPLFRERALYGALLEAKGLDKNFIEKILVEAKEEYEGLDSTEIFNAQTKVINRVNKELSSDVLNYFVQNYKNLATISQILHKELPVKERVLLEDKFINEFSVDEETKEELEPTDNLMYKTFVKNYNEKYEGILTEEQKEVITRHAVSFSDNGVSLKIFLNEEIGRLKNILNGSRDMDIFEEDEVMKTKLDEVFEILDSYKENPHIEEGDIVRLLEVQTLAREMNSNGD
jgi:hypothetical protein